MKEKEMYLHLVKDALTNAVVVVVLVVLLLFALREIFNVSLQISSVSLALGIIGTTLAFFGNNLALDALGRYDSVGLPQWKWGNKIQTLGFALTIAALLVK